MYLLNLWLSHFLSTTQNCKSQWSFDPLYITSIPFGPWGVREYFQSSAFPMYSWVSESLYYTCVYEVCSGRDSVVGLATRYGLDGPGIEFQWGQDFPHLPRPAVGPIQPPVWVRGQRQAPTALPPEEKPGTHCTGGWVTPGPVWMGAKNLAPHRDSTPGPSSPLRVAVRTTLSRPNPIAHIWRSWGLKRDLNTYNHRSLRFCNALIF